MKINIDCCNCLAPFHQRINCKSTVKSQKCQKKNVHHRFFHFEYCCDWKSESDKFEKNSTSSNSLSGTSKVFQPGAFVCTKADANSVSEVVKNSSNTSCHPDFGSHAQVLLCTAMVRVSYSFRGVRLCRALLDQDSQASFITSDCFKKFSIQKKR